MNLSLPCDEEREKFIFSQFIAPRMSTYNHVNNYWTVSFSYHEIINIYHAQNIQNQTFTPAVSQILKSCGTICATNKGNGQIRPKVLVRPKKKIKIYFSAYILLVVVLTPV
jgi:hypothetical protein